MDVYKGTFKQLKKHTTPEETLQRYSKTEEGPPNSECQQKTVLARRSQFILILKFKITFFVSFSPVDS